MRVDLYGYFGGIGGSSTLSRNLARALSRAYEVRAVDWDVAGQATHLRDGMIPIGDPDPAADVAICLAPLDFPREVLGRHRIGYFAWETTGIAARHRAVLLGFDEVWVPSRWGREVLVANGIPAARVHVVPEGVDTDLFVPAAAPPPGPFRFLCVGKWEERKGIAGLVRCFAATFAPGEEVELVLHAHNGFLRGFSIDEQLRALGLGSCAPVRASLPLGGPALAALYRDCHAFVLATRGEGWGLPILEAMASGLPTIATAHSAQLDYLDERNGFPIRVSRMVPVDDPVFFHGGEALGEWAEPDWPHLAETLRFVFEHRDEARSRGARAREDVAANWTWDHAAAVAGRRIEELA